jgi:hypothetical protein
MLANPSKLATEEGLKHPSGPSSTASQGVRQPKQNAGSPLRGSSYEIVISRPLCGLAVIDPYSGKPVHDQRP